METLYRLERDDLIVPEEIPSEELVENKRHLAQLIKHPGFKLWQNLMQVQVNNRLAIVLGVSPTMEDALAKEYKKGEISGIALSFDMVPVYIEAIRQDLQIRHPEDDGE